MKALMSFTDLSIRALLLLVILFHLLLGLSRRGSKQVIQVGINTHKKKDTHSFVCYHQYMNKS